MKKRNRSIKTDNTGASLITVIITISLLAVLGTMLAGVALVNYQMKQMDQRSKKDFYTAETALNDVYNGLGKNITAIIADSYDTALTKNNSGGAESSAFASEEEAYNYLKKEFVKQFQAFYAVGVAGDPGNAINPINSAANRETLRTALNAYIVPPASGAATVDNIGNITVDVNFNSITLKEVVVTYDNTQMDMVSSVTTDIVLSVPTLRFFDNHDYLWDYAVIGNEGVYVSSTNPDTPTVTTIHGNVFGGAGTDSTLAGTYGQKEVYGGLNVYAATLSLSGETIISGGDVNLKRAVLNVEGLTAGKMANFWAGTINLAADGTKANVFSAYGNLFLDNDLEINSSNSKVTLKGNYYGYNNNYITKESAAGGDVKKHAQSSSILVNGRKNVLDIQGLDLLLLAGRAYMDFDTSDVQSTGSEQEYGTGEALALRTSQLIYMVPTEFLPYANPEKLRSDLVSITDFDETEMSKAEWFGSDYLNPYQAVRQEIIEVGSEKFVYYFLNFKSDADRTAYVNRILNATAASAATDSKEHQAYELKHKIEERAGAVLSDDLIINGGTAACSVYSNFAVMEYDSTSGKITAASSGINNLIETNTYAQALVSRYDYIADTLDPKADVPLDTVIAAYASGPAKAGLPLKKFVDINSTDFIDLIAEFGNYAKDGISTGTECYRKPVGGTTYEVIITNGDIEMTSQSFNGVILALGDVTLTNCQVNGIVMAAGDVKLKESQIYANREIVQSIIEAESQEIDNLNIAKTAAEHKKYFVHYLTDIRYNGTFAYGKDSIGADYTQFITYENWKKGDVR